MPKYFVYNTKQNPAVILIPEVFTYEIPGEQEIEIVDKAGYTAKQLAESLVKDSGGNLKLKVK